MDHRLAAQQAGVDRTARLTELRQQYQELAEEIAFGAVLDDPLLYRDFFERISQSLFLTANEI